MKENNFIGRPYQYHDWIGEVTQFVTSGGFKGCYEVRADKYKNKRNLSLVVSKTHSRS